MNREELLNEIQAGRQRLEEALVRVDQGRVEEVVLHGDWSIKDLMGHLEFWENRVQNLYHILVQGQDPNSVSPDTGLDALNRRAFEANRDRLYIEIRRTEQSAFQSLIRLVQEASKAELFDPQHFAWTEGRMFANWLIDNSSGHYDEHLPELLAWLEQSRR